MVRQPSGPDNPPPERWDEREEVVYSTDPEEPPVERRRGGRRGGRSFSEGETEVQHAPWSPAQIVALIAGALLLVLGLVTLARAGFAEWTGQMEVLGLHRTPIMGLLEVILGAFLVMAGAVPGGLRGVMSFAGTVLLVWGIVVAIEPSAFQDAFGVQVESGWFYGIMGATVLLAGIVAPVIFGMSRVVRR